MPAAEETVTVAEPAPLYEPAPVSEDTTLAAAPAYDGDGGGSTESAVDAFGHYCDDPTMAGPPAPPPDGTGAPLTPEELIAKMHADIAKINEQVAEAKAKELAELATTADEMSFGLFSVGDSSQNKLEEELRGLPPEMRQLVVEKMGTVTVEGGGADARPLSEEQLQHVQATAKEVTDEEVARKEREERYQQRLTKNVDAMEAAAQTGDRKAIAATLDDMRPGAREDALEKMTPEARAIAEDELAKRRERLERAAERLEKAQHGKSATDGTDEVGIITELTGLSPTEAEELEEIYGEKFKDDDGKARSLRTDLKGEFGEDDKEAKFITAVLDGEEEAEELGVELAVEYLEDEAEAIVDADESGMNDLLRAHGRSPEAAARLAEAYKAKTGEELSEACTDVMDDAEYKEASAYQRGDLRTANVAVLEQGEPERTERVIEEVSDEEGGIAQLAQDTQEHTGQPLDVVLEGQLSTEKSTAIQGEVVAAQDSITKKRDEFLEQELAKLQRDPVKLAEAKKKADAVASKLSTELSKGHYVGNNFDVTQHLVGLEPAEVKLVMESYQAQAKSLGKDADLEADLRERLDGKDLKVANAALSGDKVLTAVALVEQSGDGAFTNVDAAKKALATLEKPEDRKAFLEKMNQHVGGVKDGEAFDSWVKSETSSFERDELQAMAIVDEDERAATMAQVEISKNAYAGKYAQMMEGLDDELGGLTGETDEERAKRRQSRRENDLFVQASNAGGGNEDAIVDAPAKLKNKRQLELLNEKLLAADGKTVKQTMQEELSQGRLRAGEKFADGDFEGGQAEAMVAAVTDIQLNDNEDRASAAFEQVRVPDETLAELGKIEDPVAREQAIEAEKKKARESLLARADEAARAQGHASYMALLETQLSPAELAVAKDRIADGKVSDHNALFEAGDTAVGNLGKKTEKFYEVMQNKTPEQMAKLEKDFEAAHPGVDFHEWVLSKAGSTGERRDFAIMLEGNYARMSDKDLKKKAADDPRALIKRVKDYHEAARGGADEVPYDPIANARRKIGNDLGNEMADAYGNAGERLDGRIQAVTRLEAKIDAGEQLTEAEQDELIQHMRYMSGDQQAYTDTKNQVANASAEAVGTVVEVGTTALTGSTTAGSVMGGLTEMGVKDTLNPARYSNDEKFKDIVNVAADAAGSALGSKYGKNPIGEAAIEGAVGGVGQTIGDARNLNDLGNLAEAGVKNVTEQTVSSVAGAHIEQRLGDGLGSKVLQATADELITGDPSKSGGERVLTVAKNTAKDYAKDKAASHHRKHADPTIEAREPTDDERREIEEAAAAEATAAQPAVGSGNNDAPAGEGHAADDSGVSVHPIIDVGDEGSGVSVHPIIDVGGDEGSGVSVHPIIDVGDDGDSGVSVHPIIDVGDEDSGVSVHPIIDVGPQARDEAGRRDDGPKTLADLQALRPEKHAVDPATMAAAKQNLRAGQALTTTEIQAVFALAIDAARQGITADGADVNDNASLGGACGPTQQTVADILQHVLGNNAKVHLHATHPEDKDGFAPAAIPGSKLQAHETRHYFTTVEMPDGRVLLVDPTFGQFVAEGSSPVGERLTQHEGGAAAAGELVKHGFVELTPEIANAYGRAMTGKEEDFTPGDFVTPNRAPGTHGGGNRRHQPFISQAKKQWDEIAADDAEASVARSPDEPRSQAETVVDAAANVFTANERVIVENREVQPTESAADTKQAGDMFGIARGAVEILRKDGQPKAIGEGLMTGLGKLAEEVAASVLGEAAGKTAGGMFDQVKWNIEATVPGAFEILGAGAKDLISGDFDGAHEKGKVLLGALLNRPVTIRSKEERERRGAVHDGVRGGERVRMVQREVDSLAARLQLPEVQTDVELRQQITEALAMARAELADALARPEREDDE